MTQHYLEYTIVDPPKAVKKARLDNIALVPASLLTHQGKYQTITNNLPRGECCSARRRSSRGLHAY